MATRGRLRDNQKSRVYRWEDTVKTVLREHGYNQKLTLGECERLISIILGYFGETRMPMIADGRGTSFARGGSSRISLPKWARTEIVVIHETCHCVKARRGIEAAAHGPEFVRLQINAMAKHFGLKAGTLRHTARVCGVKVAPAKSEFSTVPRIRRKVL